ncbi:transglutaminase-like cysteine peptidase [Campylobacter sp. RM12640]|uniref:transglutaminase-like cysteine peptidase n=1 Tax=unclassified Campylobacter TaxID=2593542 RepID=UPI001BD96BC6|nr:MULTISPECIES: transglutaminase-like cysteine peptidase [unclassified Campylobacter]MBZ7976224.1 transglutaminase-like cysteine peptidase [Campylobacter sp. RM12637]MBZ7977656.1 transglutaminase-like cysteine peptidase [Campylobacter sp. RM12654]MBZ7979195.1 transglutaminase-like cysteine peptidase [Campylobacter sp. RM12642]MBZ7981197.1 transglutaminase-like cysteine peptidase [Campylobacter sp. RM12640]MBZ7983327.1 transglutaminase-like cysteine peptidase [Campylobacter sp. RM12647]MBZ798
MYSRIFKRVILFTLFIGISLSSSSFIKPQTYVRMEKTYGQVSVKRLEKLDKLMQDIQNTNDANKLVKVNEFFNDPSIIKWQDDMITWGKTDYWANRFESLGKGFGDCEDFVIAKYLTLLDLGVSEEKLFFTYVYANLNGKWISHMVLAYYEKPNDIPFILDSNTNSIKRANKRVDLKPVLSFNAKDLFLAQQASSGKLSAKSSKYTKDWSSYLENLKKGDL